MKPEITTGDILDQQVDVIVNSWNRNVIPWWLLLPVGVSGAIKKRGGTAPFKEVSQFGAIPLGEARLTSAGNLPFKAIIHVAGINILWFATEYSVRRSVLNAMKIVNDNGFQSIAFPLIGSGSGNRGKEWSLNLMLDSFESVESQANVVIVKYRNN
jgi:O-acetyl-ADP-ribose deacetylase (regulator of RNase III)